MILGSFRVRSVWAMTPPSTWTRGISTYFNHLTQKKANQDLLEENGSEPSGARQPWSWWSWDASGWGVWGQLLCVWGAPPVSTPLFLKSRAALKDKIRKFHLWVCWAPPGFQAETTLCGWSQPRSRARILWDFSVCSWKGTHNTSYSREMENQKGVQFQSPPGSRKVTDIIFVMGGGGELNEVSSVVLYNWESLIFSWVLWHRDPCFRWSTFFLHWESYGVCWAWGNNGSFGGSFHILLEWYCFCV